jgi:hypothetical protein
MSSINDPHGTQRVAARVSVLGEGRFSGYADVDLTGCAGRRCAGGSQRPFTMRIPRDLHLRTARRTL